MTKYCISQNNLKDKEEDAFIGWRNLFYTWWWHKQKISYSTNESKVLLYILILNKMKVLQVETKACTVDLANKVHPLIDHDRKEQDLKIQTS